MEQFADHPWSNSWNSLELMPWIPLVFTFRCPMCRSSYKGVRTGPPVLRSVKGIIKYLQHEVAPKLVVRIFATHTWFAGLSLLLFHVLFIVVYLRIFFECMPYADSKYLTHGMFDRIICMLMISLHWVCCGSMVFPFVLVKLPMQPCFQRKVNDVNSTDIHTLWILHELACSQVCVVGWFWRYGRE